MARTTETNCAILDGASPSSGEASSTDCRSSTTGEARSRTESSRSETRRSSNSSGPRNMRVGKLRRGVGEGEAPSLSPYVPKAKGVHSSILHQLGTVFAPMLDEGAGVEPHRHYHLTWPAWPQISPPLRHPRTYSALDMGRRPLACPPTILALALRPSGHRAQGGDESSSPRGFGRIALTTCSVISGASAVSQKCFLHIKYWVHHQISVSFLIYSVASFSLTGSIHLLKWLL